jgi:hypothetical protein
MKAGIRWVAPLGLLVCGMTVLAEERPRVATPAAAKPATGSPTIQSNVLARTGGLVYAPASGPAIVVLDTQKRIPAATVAETVKQIQTLLRLPFSVRCQVGTEPIADASAVLAGTNIAVVIVVCDYKSYPSLLVAPEKRWALVNVAALGDDNAKEALVAERVHKEIWRAFGCVMGAANSTQSNCLLKPVFSLSELDSLDAKMLAADNLNRILNLSKTIGMKPSRPNTYRKAVEEGWAPAPTNECQKAIWNELRK